MNWNRNVVALYGLLISRIWKIVSAFLETCLSGFHLFGGSSSLCWAAFEPSHSWIKAQKSACTLPYKLVVPEMSWTSPKNFKLPSVTGSKSLFDIFSKSTYHHINRVKGVSCRKYQYSILILYCLHFMRVPILLLQLHKTKLRHFHIVTWSSFLFK